MSSPSFPNQNCKIKFLYLKAFTYIKRTINEYFLQLSSLRNAKHGTLFIFKYIFFNYLKALRKKLSSKVNFYVILLITLH